MRRTPRQQQAEQTRLLAAAVVMLFGLALFRNGQPVAQAVGLVLCLPAGAWLLAQAGRVLHDWQIEREREAVKAAKQARKTQRRAREEAEREKQRRQQETAARAQAKQAAAEEAKRQEVQRQREEQEVQRAARAERLEAEASRWNGMEAKAFRADLALLLEHRGLLPSPKGEGTFAGQEQIALCVPANRKAEKADVENLEQQRREANATQAFLIARRGFAPDAVRRVRDFPAITLVEAHLLAEWNLRER